MNETVYLIGTALSALAAVLAWLAKLFWSREYISAKDEIIESKNAEIELLKTQVNHYKELTPMKIKEYFDSVKDQLEDYNDELKEELQEAHDEIEKKNKKIEEIKSSGEKQQEELEKTIQEKKDLEQETKKLEEELDNLKQNTEEFDVFEIPEIDASVMRRIAKITSNINKTFDASKQIQNYLNTVENFDFILPTQYQINEELGDAKPLVTWFLQNYEDPAESVPYESKEGGYQYMGNEPYDAREVLAEKFPKTDQEIIDKAVNFLEKFCINWVRKDRLE